MRRRGTELAISNVACGRALVLLLEQTLRMSPLRLVEEKGKLRILHDLGLAPQNANRRGVEATWSVDGLID